jgi:hypothetical protein
MAACRPSLASAKKANNRCGSGRTGVSGAQKAQAAVADRYQGQRPCGRHALRESRVGHDRVAHSHPAYQQLLKNSVYWVAQKDDLITSGQQLVATPHAKRRTEAPSGVLLCLDRTAGGWTFAWIRADVILLRQ